MCVCGSPAALLDQIQRAVQLQWRRVGDRGSGDSVAPTTSGGAVVAASSDPKVRRKKGTPTRHSRGKKGPVVGNSRGRRRRVSSREQLASVEVDRVVLWSSDTGGGSDTSGMPDHPSAQPETSTMRERVLSGEFLTVRDMYPEGRDSHGAIIGGIPSHTRTRTPTQTHTHLHMQSAPRATALGGRIVHHTTT